MGWEIHLTDLERGEKTNRSFMQASVRIGRAPENELQLKHNQISRLHLTLSKEGERYFAEDSSRNGSFVKIGEHWTRISGKVEIKPPATLRFADWLARVDYVVEEQWDQSVMIPAGRLGKHTEAILVFDLCDSSRIASEDDQMAYHMKQRLTQIADPVLAEFGVRFFKSTGDGFLATFPDATKALAATLELENRIQHRNSKTSNAPIHYRLALHYGETWSISAGGQDIHGNDVNITFRIEGVQSEAFANLALDLPRRDRILCSASLERELAKDALSGARTEHCGAATLKGITDPVDIYLVRTSWTERA